MRNGRVFIDSFSAGLDDLTRKQQGSELEVLKKLSTMKRFSTFEASENNVIGYTMTTLFKLKFLEDTGGSYPWTQFKITDAGLAFMKANGIPTTQPQEKLC